MDAAQTLHTARQRAGLTLRALADRAGTSHSTLAAYESGRKVPSVATLERVVRAAGFSIEPQLARRVTGGNEAEGSARGEELAEVLLLAAAFPARHAQRLEAPVFGR